MVAPAPRTRSFAVLLLLLLTAVLEYAVLFLSTPIAQSDRAGREDRNIYLLVLGLLGLALSVDSIRRRTPQGARWDRESQWLALILPCYAAVQLLPLPLSVLRVLSPARATGPSTPIK